jgi:hypothetical protein
MRRLLPLLPLLLASPLLAQEALDAEGFDAFHTGRSFAITDPQGASSYGIEHYFPDRRVTWRSLGTGECLEGTWYESSDFAGGPAICFDYENATTVCWRLVAQGESVDATLLGAPGSTFKTEGFRIDPAPGATFCDWLGS